MIFAAVGGPQEIHAISEAKKQALESVDLLRYKLERKDTKILTCCIVQSLKFINFATPKKWGFPQYEKR